MRDLRILITGSRDWIDRDKLEVELIDYIGDIMAFEQLSSVTIVDGAATSGADAMAHAWAAYMRYNTERHPADWRPNGKFDKTAGFKRNSKMVELGADIVFAFIMPCSKPDCKRGEPGHDSHGTANTIKSARAAGIEVKEIRP